MSKPGFSFGLKNAGLAKPAPPRRKPAPFGGGDDDASGDETPSNVAKVSELNIFGNNTLSTATNTSPKSKRKANKNPLADPPPSKPSQQRSTTNPSNPFTDLSSALTSRKHAASASATDPSIYDYDAAYDSFKAAKAAAAAAAQDSATAEKRPRYFDALQTAAEVRERDRQIAEERRLQRERAAEGDEFADKEKFVTEAYRRQQEENRRLEAEEEKREEEERKTNKGRGLAKFYQSMLDRGERENAALVKAAEEGVGLKKEAGGEEAGEKSAAERAREINAQGGNVLVNEEGEVVDKRQLLKGGLNVAAKKKAEVQQEKEKAAAAASARAGAGGAQGKAVYAAGGKQAMRERQTRMLEAQLEESLKRSRQEEEAETAKVELASKTRKTATEISSAKERYLARKRAAEEAEKNGEAEEP